MNGITTGPFIASKVAQITTGGDFATVVCQVQGTISTGNLKLRGTINGVDYFDMLTENVATGGQVEASNKIEAAGLYRVASAGIKVVCAEQQNSFASSGLVINFSASQQTPPNVILGLG